MSGHNGTLPLYNDPTNSNLGLNNGRGLPNMGVGSPNPEQLRRQQAYLQPSPITDGNQNLQYGDFFPFMKDIFKGMYDSELKTLCSLDVYNGQKNAEHATKLAPWYDRHAAMRKQFTHYFKEFEKSEKKGAHNLHLMIKALKMHTRPRRHRNRQDRRDDHHNQYQDDNDAEELLEAVHFHRYLNMETEL